MGLRIDLETVGAGDIVDALLRPAIFDPALDHLHALELRGLCGRPRDSQAARRRGLSGPLEDYQVRLFRVADGIEGHRAVEGHEAPSVRHREVEQIEICDLAVAVDASGVDPIRVEKAQIASPEGVMLSLGRGS